MAQKRMLLGLRAQSLWESPLRTPRFLWAVQYLSRLWDHKPGHPHAGFSTRAAAANPRETPRRLRAADCPGLVSFCIERRCPGDGSKAVSTLFPSVP